MPTYEYECTKCGHTFEAFQSITEKPLSRCPRCQSRIKRLIGGGMGVIFKGSGFYTTDYKRSSALTGNGKSSSGGKEKEKEGAKESSPEKTAAS